MERVKIRKVIGITVLVNLICLTAVSSAAVLTFDDVTSEPDVEIPDGYGGLNWDNLNALDWLAYEGSTESGYYYGRVSGDYVAANPFADPAIVSNSSFDFIGAYLTAAWNEGLNIDVEGYQGTTLVYSQTVVVDPYAPTWFQFDYMNINKLRFVSYGGINAGLPGAGEHFAMDNFTYVPEPATTVLLGLGSLFAIGRRRSK